ncbi:unnamed protein product [Rotaria sp. Silwood2]|nr:unnamed protein product [Rotaria sp. Silwood2]CAF2757699.1 unnamed protein product [Rotaria sp. Silwood2]CAF3161522.1 unnamed protein product [Rotaria sp. Silwood2]CAF4042697.1 unnamed protein product [Rotaria sp. Silwood2]CAF4210422.1 unnamed protein product [Rotaria sp. Silwood2]
MNVGVNGGRFDFDDGGTYCGGWNDGKAHGHGVCTGPKGQGEYSGAWQYGYEFSGIYLWPAGNSYEGQWMSGKRHGLGVEKKGRWIYKGEWTQGFKGRYGIRVSDISGARYEGTWANGLQDGYGVEIYADGGIYHGQIQQGLRHGFGIRRSVPYGVASRYRSKDVRDSLTSLRSEEDDERTQRERDKRMDENRGGFVLRSRSEPHDSSSRSASQGPRRGSLSNSADRRTSLRKTLLSKLRKQKSTSDIEDLSITKKTSSFRSTASTVSGDSKHSVKTATMISSHPNTPNSFGTLDDGDHSFISQDDILDNNVVETYMGEWKADKRTGFGIAERSDGLKYEGEWFNNKKNGYGVTTFRDGSKEEGKYKNNVLVTDKRKPSKLFLLRSSKFRDKIDSALNHAMKSATTAQQKAEIAMARANNARSKAHSAEIYAKQARNDSVEARVSAKAAAPDFRQPGEEKPQPFISLDIDRQIDGKPLPSNHINVSPPNGRLPMSSNYLPNSSIPLPLHISQSHPITATASPSFPLDGGVYQGQPPTQANNWNPNTKNVGSSSSTIPMHQQRQDYYRDVNQLQPHHPQKAMPTTLYNETPDLRTGLSVSKHHSNFTQPLSTDISVPNNLNYDYDRTNFNSVSPSQSSPSQFVQNAVGVGERSTSKRNTFKRTTRVDASNEDLLHDPQQFIEHHHQLQQHEYNQPSSNLHAPRPIRHPSGLRPNVSPYMSGPSTSNTGVRHNLIHGAHDSPHSSVYDSGLSSLGTSFDREQHHIFYLGNQNHPSISTTPKTFTVEQYEVPQPIPIPRRKSLPSIVKTKPGDYKIDETARSSDNLQEKETFIIENGIRKRVTELGPTYTESGTPIPQATVMTSSSGSPTLARRIILESVTQVDAPTSTMSGTGGNKRGSMPTLVTVARQRQAAPSKFIKKENFFCFRNLTTIFSLFLGISREEATILGSQRREELRRLRDRDSTTFGRLKTLLQV